jgi:cytosine/adenosine deaminase-related metal-dependent hydrolase
MSDLMLRDVRLWPREPGGELVDVEIRGGRIASIAPAGTVAGDPAVSVAHGLGGVLLPALVDGHAHLDSTRLGLPFRPHTAEPGLTGLIANDRANWRDAGASVADRATHTLAATISSGVTAVRSHAQVDSDCALERLEGVLAAKEAHAARARVQVVAFPQSGILRDAGTADLLDAALRAGAGLRPRRASRHGGRHPRPRDR